MQVTVPAASKLTTFMQAPPPSASNLKLLCGSPRQPHRNRSFLTGCDGICIELETFRRLTTPAASKSHFPCRPRRHLHRTRNFHADHHASRIEIALSLQAAPASASNSKLSGGSPHQPHQNHAIHAGLAGICIELETFMPITITATSRSQPPCSGCPCLHRPA